MDPISEARLGAILPQLAAKIRQIAEMVALDKPPLTFRVTQGLRSWNEQAKLYAQGRTEPGPIVTNAPPGYSQHQFGLAVDIVPMGINDIPDWDENHPIWKRLIQVGESLGLTAGAEFRTFPDYPHLQLQGTWPITPNDEERQVFREGGCFAVWEEAGLAPEGGYHSS